MATNWQAYMRKRLSELRSAPHRYQAQAPRPDSAEEVAARRRMAAVDMVRENRNELSYLQALTKLSQT